MFRPPLSVAARPPRCTGLKNSDGSELWTSDIVLTRYGVFIKIFENVVFAERMIESKRIAYISGIERREGLHVESRVDLPGVLVETQREFLAFLRSETERERAQLGRIASICQGIDYSAEAQATAAYIVQRDEPLDIAVGYAHVGGTYELLWIEEDTAGFLEDARATHSFDELAGHANNHAQAA